MRRHIPGLHSGHHGISSNLDGIFLVCVQQASYRWHPQKPFLALRFGILEPTTHEASAFRGDFTAQNARYGNSPGFFAISVMTRTCSIETRSMRKPS